MSAEILRAAADRLDELAGAARAGRWSANGDAVVAEWADGPRWVATCEGSALQAGNEANAAYIAAMHPEVGKALSAWLRAEYAHAVAVGMTGTRAAPALTIARLILGGDA